MNFKEYQQQAQRTADQEMKLDKRILIAALGLIGESAEVTEHIKKYIGHGHTLNNEKVKEELGDVIWYIAELSSALGLDLGQIANYNIDKLRVRYPKGFLSKDSINRERTITATGTVNIPVRNLVDSKDDKRVITHRNICSKLTDTYKAKNKDYGDSFKKLRDKYPNSILIRLNDKLNRLETLTNDKYGPLVLDESIEDTLIDMANYCIMEVIERRIANES